MTPARLPRRRGAAYWVAAGTSCSVMLLAGWLGSQAVMDVAMGVTLSLAAAIVASVASGTSRPT